MDEFNPSRARETHHLMVGFGTSGVLQLRNVMVGLGT
jgi:hypothetical protein